MIQFDMAEVMAELSRVANLLQTTVRDLGGGVNVGWKDEISYVLTASSRFSSVKIPGGDTSKLDMTMTWELRESHEEGGAVVITALGLEEGCQGEVVSAGKYQQLAFMDGRFAVTTHSSELLRETPDFRTKEIWAEEGGQRRDVVTMEDCKRGIDFITGIRQIAGLPEIQRRVITSQSP